MGSFGQLPSLLNPAEGVVNRYLLIHGLFQFAVVSVTVTQLNQDHFRLSHTDFQINRRLFQLALYLRHQDIEYFWVFFALRVLNLQSLLGNAFNLR